MDKADNMHLVKMRAASLEGSMNSFPEDVIGIILSHMDCAQDMVMASSTCHKWHDASMHHLQRLTFQESDFAANIALYMREIIITKMVMKRSCLCELSIYMAENYELQPATVIAWLLHTKETLKSLTLSNRIKPRLNILQTLGAKVEHLHWRFAHIPTVTPTTGSFKSLVSLTLVDTPQVIPGNLEALLTVCCKLESLSLTKISFSPDGTGLLELHSSSLKILYIEQGLNGINKLVLHAERLEDLAFMEVRLELFKLVQGSGNSALRNMAIEGSHIAQLDFGEAANSLLYLELNGMEDLRGEWVKYYKVVSRASKLKKLRLRGMSLEMTDNIDIYKIVASFPCLYALSIEYEYAWECFTSRASGLFPILEMVTVLELCCYQLREGFLPWVAGFLEHSPNLKQLKICVDDATARFGNGEKRLSRFTTSMFQMMRSYPCVELSFDYSC